MLRKTFSWSVGLMGLVVLCPGLVLGDENATKDDAKPTSILDFEVQDIDGKPVALADYKGDVLLIVNVASECGLTQRNYSKLEPLFEKYRGQGFRILAFPANNFGGQEPGSNSQIKQFCTTKHGASYDLFAKVSVKGEDICPLYRYLTEETGKKIAGEVQWNFQKYLVDRRGEVIARFSPKVDPDSKKLIKALEEALESSKPMPKGE